MSGVAITGMSCLFPGAPDVDAYWRNILGKVDAVSDPPPEAWDPDVYYDPEFENRDATYCNAAATSVRWRPSTRWRTGSRRWPWGEPDQWLALRVAQAALADAHATELADEVRSAPPSCSARGRT